MKAEDLTGQIFGHLKVIGRAEDHVSAGGQKKVRWNCECLLCGNTKAINAQDLKRGNAVSCGCLQAYKGKQNRNKKTCVICGKQFESPPSDKKVTCSKECQREYARIRATGAAFSEERRRKISEKAKEKDLTELQKIATKAAQESPNSGKFETNVNAIDWHLISPDGEHYYFHSLNNWLRENGQALFGCAPDSREFNNVRSGLTGAKRALLGGSYQCCTYKGWQVKPTDADLLNPDIIARNTAE